MPRLGGAVIMLLALFGCSMAKTVSIDEAADVGCESSGGHYSLSRTLISILVSKTNGTIKFEGAGTVPYADTAHTYCLDYLANPTADDIVKIDRSEKGLLQHVSTDALDQSRFILEAIIRTIFVGITGAPGFDPRASIGDDSKDRKVIFSVEYDPFDAEQTAFVNAGLNKHGFCVVLKGFTFDHRRTTTNRYCDNPLYEVKRAPPRWFTNDGQPLAPRAAEPVTEPKLLRGLLYRPKIAYTYYLFSKKNKRLPGGWELRSAEAIGLENISPILSVGVDRSFFAQRKTVIHFTDGILQNICVYKTSELEEAINIPFAIASSLVAVPTQFLQVRIDQTNSDRRLVEAETQLLKVQNAHLEALEAEQTTQAVGLGNLNQLQKRQQDHVQRQNTAAEKVLEDLKKGDNKALLERVERPFLINDRPQCDPPSNPDNKQQEMAQPTKQG